MFNTCHPLPRSKSSKVSTKTADVYSNNLARPLPAVSQEEAVKCLPANARVTLHRDDKNGRWRVHWVAIDRGLSGSWLKHGKVESLGQTLNWVWSEFTAVYDIKCPHTWVADHPCL